MKEIDGADLQLDASKQQYIHDTGMKDYITGVINGNILDAVVTTWLYELQALGNLYGMEVGKTGEELHRQLSMIKGQIMEQL